MVKIAIVEDELIYTQQLQKFLAHYKLEKKEEFEIACFSDGDGIIEIYKAQFDIILMDVKMKFMDGMSAAEEIRKIDKEVIIIFITSMKHYAIRGYAVGAMDYFLKPINYFAFSERLAKAINIVKHKNDKIIIIKIRRGILRISVSDIYYIESRAHVMIYHTVSGNYETAGVIKNVAEELADSFFFQGNKGYLINLAHVEGIKDGCAIVCGEKLLLSRSRKNQFMEALMNYWSEVKS